MILSYTGLYQLKLTLVLRIPDFYDFLNTVDTDQLMKPSDHDPHFFHPDLKHMLTTRMLQVNMVKWGRSKVQKYSACQGLIAIRNAPCKTR